MKAGTTRAIDPGQLRALLRAYFRLSVRETVLMKRRGGPTSFFYVLVVYGIVGVLIGCLAFLRPPVLLYAVALHTMTFFAVGMSAIIEANEILFDRREEEILFPLPVHPSTLLLAKSATLVGFSGLIGLALNLGPTFLGLAAADARPWFPLAHLASVLLLTVFACACVVCVYGFVLRIFGRERFESLAVFAQVGMVVMIVGGMQVVPRLLEGKSPEKITEIAQWLLPTPPGWFAAFDAWLGGSTDGGRVLAFAGVALAATALLVWLAVVRLASGYGEASARAASVPRPIAEPKDVAARPWRSRNALLRRWLRDPIEWAAFRLTGAYLRRDREIRLRVYTSLSMFAVFVVLSILDAQRQRTTFMPMVMLAFSGTAVLTAIEALESSSQFAASEIFAAAPLESAAPLYHGVRKACMLFVQAPLVLASLVLILVLPIGKLGSVTIVAPILVLLPTLSLVPGAIGPYLPLSQPPRRGEQTAKRVLMILGTMLGTMALVGVGFLAWRFGFLWLLVLLEIPAVFALNAWLRRVIRVRPMPRLGDA